MSTKKRCPNCKKEKELFSFWKNTSWCISCARGRDRERYLKRKETKLTYQKKYYENNREMILQKAKDKYREDLEKSRKKGRETHAKNKARAREKRLQSLYSLSLSEYDSMLKKQGGVCAANKCPFNGVKDVHVDHCHTTQKVRGILCGNCNRAIGYAKDDPSRLRGLADYLERAG